SGAGGGGGGRVGGEGDAGLADVLEADDDFGLVEDVVVGDVFLFETLEVEVASVAQERRTVRIVAYVDGVTLEDFEQLGENVGAAIEDGRRDDGGWAKKTAVVEAREDFIWGGEEDCETEGKVVGVVTRGVKYIARYLKVTIAYLDKY
ncbi:MAG: hypothetical protein Q9157_007814, partial [Trypethelium eluteriae]